MFCGKCGNQIPDGSSFCPMCGAQLGGSSAPQQDPVGGNDYGNYGSYGTDNSSYGSEFGAGFASGSSNPNCTNGFAGIFGFWLDMWRKNYINAKGRATRKEYWSIVIINAIIGGILGAIWTPIGGLYSLATLLPSICVAIRRCHDIGKKGTLLVVAYIMELVGTILTSVGAALVATYTFYWYGTGQYYGGAGPVILTVIGAVIVVAAAVIMLIIALKASQREDNQWGPYPFK